MGLIVILFQGLRIWHPQIWSFCMLEYLLSALFYPWRPLCDGYPARYSKESNKYRKESGQGLSSSPQFIALWNHTEPWLLLLHWTWTWKHGVLWVFIFVSLRSFSAHSFRGFQFFTEGWTGKVTLSTAIEHQCLNEKIKNYEGKETIQLLLCMVEEKVYYRYAGEYRQKQWQLGESRGHGTRLSWAVCS